MSDAFYSLVRTVCHPPFIVSRQPSLIRKAAIPKEGRYLIAANHTSPYDICLLMAHCKRRIDFVSITEICERPIVGRFYMNMNVMPLDRSKADTGTVRRILARLEQERLVCMFPEGRFQRGEKSMLEQGRMRPGLGRIAGLSQSPVIPVVIVDSLVYSKPTSWAPLRRTRYGVMFGEPMQPPPSGDSFKQNAKDFEADYHARMKAMYAELKAAMPDRDASKVGP